jgi:hypothetical protein
MASKNNIATHQIPGMWFVKFPFRSDINFFSYDLEALKKEITKQGYYSYQPDIYEVQFWLKKPIFKKYTLAQLKKLNLR